jgi:flagellar biosynthesis protein FlhG|tara:strand:+ start:19777 stop:20538 length:762 start_codon:yes stop_codon:yes gene_type:complete
MNNPASSFEQNLITIASGKGGVGKTWFASTLCHALALKGRKALLFDCDFGLANVDIQLGLMPQHDLGEVISNEITLEQAVYKQAESGLNFDVISGQSGSGALASLKMERLIDLGARICNLAQDYDYTIMDLGAGVENSVMTLARASDKVIVVITADPTSLTDAYAFIKLHNMRNNDAEIQIVVNMAEDQSEGRRAFDKILKVCQNFLNISPKLLGIINRDRHVADAIRSQTPLLSRYPQSSAGENVIEIARKL